MSEIDWDAPDPDEGVINFEDLEEGAAGTPLKKEFKPTPKPSAVREEPPKAAQRYIEPPLVMTTAKQEKMIESAAKSAQKLSKELESLDYNLDKFIKFEKKISSFKIKNTIAIGVTALLLGGYIGSFAQSELNNYYINQELKHKLGEAKADLELLKKARDLGVNFAIDDNRIVIYSSSQNKSVTVSKDSNHQIFEIKIGAKR